MRFNLTLIRNANWMTPERAIAYRNILLTIQMLAAVVIVAGSRNGLDFDGRPIGTDFISFWAASKIALTGAFSQVYDASVHWAVQRDAFAGAPLNYTAFFYPPIFLLICFPLALLPYGFALLCWLAATGAAFLTALGRLSGGYLATVLAFPAVWLNIGHGQNGFLTAALFAGAARCLETRPILAGMLLGGLIYKPHFLAIVPVVLIAGARWRSAAAAIATAIVLIAVSVVVFGPGPWFGFLTDTAVARIVLEQGMVGDHRIISLFAAVRILGGSLGAAYTAQAVLAVIVAVTAAWICRQGAAQGLSGVVLAAAALLVSPFLLVYDLVLLAVPLLWLWRAARDTGFLPWEKMILMVAFVMPLVAVEAAFWLHLPLAQLSLLAVFVSVARHKGSSLSLIPTESR